MFSSINEATITATWHIATGGNFPKLRERCLQWLRLHFKWAIRQPLLTQALDFADFKELISKDNLDVNDEEDRYRSIAYWHQQKGARSNLNEFGQLLEYVDWTLVPEQSLFNLVFEESRQEFR